ncbi:GNAT family N-acetyltransferase [Nonomuraea sp. LPB2021202275-12-8]|uniref:GNAT family N-acetyltransferase n=1 Tax=Nonomuraea sp. LPB2021202275-12-8 TaxID=3120159 RepID=UPI00300C41BC
MIRELTSLAEVRAACGDDDLPVWAAQDLRGGARAWTLGDAVVTAAPEVSRHNRLAVWGGTSCAVELVRHALSELGPSYRPFGERELMSRVTAELDGIEAAGKFSWMSLAADHGRSGDPAGGVADDPGGATWSGGDAGSGRLTGPDGVAWLGEDADGEIATLLAGHAPDSYAAPGMPGVSRWAGTRIGGVLASVAADAWSAPSVGLLAGVATHDGFRGRRLAERVCRWVSRELVAKHGRAALMVDDDNAPAIGVYERLGYRRRLVMASYATT